MNKLKISVAGIALATVASSAFAGGLDRASFGSSILFEDGEYAEISFANTNPDIAPSNGPFGGLALNSSWEVASPFDTVQLGYKADIDDKFSIALTFNSNPYGVDIDYAPFNASVSAGVSQLASLRANLSSKAVTAMAKYKATERVSAFAALKYHTVSGSANVSVPLGSAIGKGDITGIGLADLPAGAGVVSLDSDSALAPIIGVSYEIKDIALRVAASYEFGTEMSPTVRSVNPTYAAAAGSIKTPDSFLLEFQSGVAANTLVFGSIRHSKWSDAQVRMSSTYDNYQLSDFDDSTTYNIGIGRKFSEKFSASLSLTHAPSSCDDASLLSPTCTQNTLSIGGKYTLENGVAISGGISLRKYEDATFWGTDGAAGGGDDIVFGGNTLKTLGVKLSKSF